MDAGKLDTRIEIKRLTKSADNFGGFTSTKATHATLWANKKDKSGEMITQNSQRKFELKTLFTIRKKSADQISLSDTIQIVGDSDEYRINSKFDSVHKYYTVLEGIKLVWVPN